MWGYAVAFGVGWWLAKQQTLDAVTRSLAQQQQPPMRTDGPSIDFGIGRTGFRLSADGLTRLPPPPLPPPEYIQ